MVFKPVDRLSLAYALGVCLLIGVFHRSVTGWWIYWLAFSAYALAVLAGVAWYNRLPGNRTAAFFRQLYPLIATLGLYKSIEGYVTVLHGRFLDAELAGFEKAVLGFHPTLALQSWISPGLTEFLKFAYFSYYAYIIVPPLLLFFRRRDRELEFLVFAVSLAFAISYIGFVILPVAGPRYYFAGTYAMDPLPGYFFTRLQDWIMAHGDTLGACFPSSHVAVAWVVLLGVRRIFGSRLFWLILPFTLALTFSVVYHRYHYLSDAVAGWLVALAVNWVAIRFYDSNLAIQDGQTPVLRER